MTVILWTTRSSTSQASSTCCSTLRFSCSVPLRYGQTQKINNLLKMKPRMTEKYLRFENISFSLNSTVFSVTVFPDLTIKLINWHQTYQNKHLNNSYTAKRALVYEFSVCFFRTLIFCLNNFLAWEVLC